MKKHHDKRGQLLLLTVIVLGSVSFLSLLLHNILQRNNQFANLRYHQESAIELADAGIEYERWDMNINLDFNGDTHTLATGQVVTNINKLSSNLAEIESIGYSPSIADPVATRTIKLNAVIDTSDVAFNYGVQVGEGGVTMDNNSEIDGNLFSNGSISGSGTITRTAQVATSAVLAIDYGDQAVGQDGEYRFGYTLDELDVAQSFEAASNDDITKVSMKLKKKCKNLGQCPSNSTVYILGDDGSGNPDENNIITTGTLDSTKASETNYGWIDVPVAPAPLVNGNVYWITIDTSSISGTGDLDKYWYWAKWNENQGFGNGQAKYSPDWNDASPVWTVIVGDMNFRVFTGSSTTFIDGITINENAHAYEISNATIGGNAEYMIIDGVTTVSGSICPNVNCIADTPAPAIQNLPLSPGNISDFIDEAAAGTPTAGDVIIDGTNTSIGPTVIDGNLVVKNSAELRIDGTVHVLGNITVENNGVIYLNGSYGELSGTVMTDGKIVTQNNGTYCGSGWDTDTDTCDDSNGSYIMLLTTYKGLQDITDPAIDVKNNTESVIFYASEGMILLSQNAGLYEAVGYKLHLNEGTSVTYQTGLADTKFISGPGASWQVQQGSWREIF
ncbi:hypothetical protein ACFL04_04495 [Patescibacteria group bacterium]